MTRHETTKRRPSRLNKQHDTSRIHCPVGDAVQSTARDEVIAVTLPGK